MADPTSAASPPARPVPLPRALLLTWAALVSLTLLGAGLSGSGLGRTATAAALLGLAGAKLLLIALVFMDLRAAHRAWLVMVSGGALAVLGICFFAWRG